MFFDHRNLEVSGTRALSAAAVDSMTLLTYVVLGTVVSLKVPRCKEDTNAMNIVLMHMSDDTTRHALLDSNAGGLGSVGVQAVKRFCRRLYCFVTMPS